MGGSTKAFNSLYAQRESCLNYVLSQVREGWIALDDHYDESRLLRRNLGTTRAAKTAA